MVDKMVHIILQYTEKLFSKGNINNDKSTESNLITSVEADINGDCPSPPDTDTDTETADESNANILNNIDVSDDSNIDIPPNTENYSNPPTSDEDETTTSKSHS